MTTQREYLASLGLAKMGRGRFSVEAKAALARAVSEGMSFSDLAPAVKPATEKKPKVSVPEISKDDNSDISPRAVREWATANPTLLPPDVKVNPKGRIDWRIYTAYRANVAKVVTRAEEEDAQYGPNPEHRFPEHVMFRGKSADGKTVTVDGRQVCSGDNGCGYSLWYCRCPGNPQRFTLTQYGMIPVVPVNG